MPKQPFFLRMVWISITIAVIFFDQLTKILCTLYLNTTSKISILSGFGFGFDLVLRYNSGAAFSFLADAAGWQRWFFVGLAFLMSIIIFIWLGRLSQYQKLESLALSLILGGALGNMIDRILYGHVIDFILLFYKDWQFPAFNIADSAISIGAFLLVLAIFKDNKSSLPAVSR